MVGTLRFAHPTVLRCRFNFQTAKTIQISVRDLAARSTQVIRSHSPSKTEGAGKAGCPLHPQPRVQNKKAHEHSHHRFTGITRPSLRNGFNSLFRALPGDRALLPPSLRGNRFPQNLTPASGRQDHTTSPSAHVPLVNGTSASTASRLNVRDDRDTPLLSRWDGAEEIADLG
jgi:hypothetical protein